MGFDHREIEQKLRRFDIVDLSFYQIRIVRLASDYVFKLPAVARVDRAEDARDYVFARLVILDTKLI